jgi:hypothetical protein
MRYQLVGCIQLEVFREGRRPEPRRRSERDQREGMRSMTGTVLDHRLVRDYLCQLDAAMRSLPAAQETLAEVTAAHNPDASLTAHGSGLNTQSWYANQAATIAGTRTVADGLVASITSRASTLRSHATQTLQVTSLVTLVLLLLVVVTLAVAARTLVRPRRRLGLPGKRRTSMWLATAGLG